MVFKGGAEEPGRGADLHRAWLASAAIESVTGSSRELQKGDQSQSRIGQRPLQPWTRVFRPEKIRPRHSGGTAEQAARDRAARVARHARARRAVETGGPRGAEAGPSTQARAHERSQNELGF